MFYIFLFQNITLLLTACRQARVLPPQVLVAQQRLQLLGRVFARDLPLPRLHWAAKVKPVLEVVVRELLVHVQQGEVAPPLSTVREGHVLIGELGVPRQVNLLSETRVGLRSALSSVLRSRCTHANTAKEKARCTTHQQLSRAGDTDTRT